MKKKNLLLVVMAISAFSLFGCSESDYEKNLRSGYEKYQTGGKMSGDEYKAVNDFNKWKSSNSEKTYDQWNSN